MPWRRIFLFLFCLCAQLYAEQPFQNWLTLSFSKRLDYSLELMFESENWFADTEPTVRETMLSPLLIWRYSPRYDFSIGYMWRNMNEKEGSASLHQGVFGVMIKVPIKEFLITSRQRVEYGVDGNDETVGRFRQRWRINYSSPSFFNNKLRPFIADEWFYNLEESFFAQNRLYGGIAYEIAPNLMIELYGMRQDIWSADGTNVNGPVVGMNIMTIF